MIDQQCINLINHSTGNVRTAIFCIAAVALGCPSHIHECSVGTSAGAKQQPVVKDWCTADTSVDTPGDVHG